MWKWYKNSIRCYAYLSDVSSSLGSSELEAEFRQSEWFKRGWTLQELIAPRYVDFLNSEWNLIGNKFTKKEIIEAICGIPSSLTDPWLWLELDLHSFTIAMRMSWARKRQTSRKEDMAYCLMGLFSVHMPLLYGEGDRAFSRLCEEILKTSNDDCMFLHNGMGLLPRSPGYFSGSYSRLEYKPGRVQDTNMYSLSKGDLRVENATKGEIKFYTKNSSPTKIEYLSLNCKDGPSKAKMWIGEAEHAQGEFYKSIVAGRTLEEHLSRMRKQDGEVGIRNTKREEKRTSFYMLLWY